MILANNRNTKIYTLKKKKHEKQVGCIDRYITVDTIGLFNLVPWVHVPTFTPMVPLAPMVQLTAEKRSWLSGFQWYKWYKWLPMIQLVNFPIVPLREPRTEPVVAKLPTLESHMIQYDVLNFRFINFSNKHCFYQDDSSKY